MGSLDVLIQPDWHLLSYCFKLVLLKLMHKAFHDELPQVLSRIALTQVMKTLTFKGTSTTTIRFRREDFNYIFARFCSFYCCIYIYLVKL